MRKIALTLLAALALTGCAGDMASLVRALAKDPATACLTITTIYGTGKFYRTAIPNGTVNCSQDGMTVKAGGASVPDGSLAVPVNVPAMTIVPSVTLTPAR